MAATEDVWDACDASWKMGVSTHLVGDDLGVDRCALASGDAVDLRTREPDQVGRTLARDLLDGQICELEPVLLDQHADCSCDASHDVGLALCVEGIGLRLVERVVDRRQDVLTRIDDCDQERQLVFEDAILDGHATADVDDSIRHRHPSHVAEALDVEVGTHPKDLAWSSQELASSSVELVERDDADPALLEREGNQTCNREVGDVSPTEVKEFLPAHRDSRRTCA